MRNFDLLTYYDEVNRIYRWKKDDSIPSDHILTVSGVDKGVILRSAVVRARENIKARNQRGEQ